MFDAPSCPASLSPPFWQKTRLWIEHKNKEGKTNFPLTLEISPPAWDSWNAHLSGEKWVLSLWRGSKICVSFRPKRSSVRGMQREDRPWDNMRSSVSSSAKLGLITFHKVDGNGGGEEAVWWDQIESCSVNLRQTLLSIQGRWVRVWSYQWGKWMLFDRVEILCYIVTMICVYFWKFNLKKWPFLQRGS